MTNLEIENVIVASHLGKDVELIKLATELPNARYSSSGNPSVIIELDRTNPKFIGHKRLKAAGVLFGNGKVLKIEGKDANKKAVIFFEKVGQKMLLLKFAKLEIEK